MVVAAVFLSLRSLAQVEPVAGGTLRASVSESGVVVRAENEETARAGLACVFRMNAEICRAFAVTSPPPRFVAWYTDAAAWSNFSGHAGGADGRGLCGAGSIAILAATNDGCEPLAHELVHLVLKQSSPGPLPLWFEEGGALFFGWRAAQAVARTDGRNLVRSLPALHEDELLPTDVIFGCLNYPVLPGSKFAYYRQSEELVRALDEKLGDEGVRKLFVALAGDADLGHCLKREFEYGEADVRLIADMMRARATHKQSW